MLVSRVDDPYFHLWIQRQEEKGLIWYQSFPWKKGLGHSQEIWDALCAAGISFSNKTVCDIGSNLGYMSFQAYYAGAVYVYGIEKNPQYLHIAQIIRDKIEHIPQNKVYFTDYTLCLGHESIPSGFDIIFYLSVHHQLDPEYVMLDSTITELKQRANELIIELILPPRFGNTKTEEEIDTLINGHILRTYQSRSRGIRRVWYYKN